MPGSKTFTSTKKLELLEFSLIEEYQKLQKPTRASRTFRGVIDVAKACLSTMLSAAFVLNENLSEIFSLTEREFLIKKVVLLGIKICSVFLLGYILASTFFYLASFLLDAIFNSRLLKTNQAGAKQSFYRITINLIMLAVSFEHKCCVYHEKEEAIVNEYERNTWIDLEIEYFLQAISYFELAEKRLQDAIPEQMKSKRKEKVNQKFVDYIGFDNLIVHITIALQSMERLKNFYANVDGQGTGFEKLCQRINGYEYKQPVKNQGKYLDELICEYRAHPDLVILRKQKYEQEL